MVHDIRYDEEQLSSTRSVAPASIDTAIDSGNVGFKMLQKFGWKGNEGLGKDGKGLSIIYFFVHVNRECSSQV